MIRMKENYEKRSRTFLTRRTPVIIRLDGKAFHTYTKGLDKPFDEGLIEDMQLTAQYLCENIQGCKLAYTQSDEISLLLTDYDGLDTQAWFDYNVQKMTSISASMASAKFNQLRQIRVFNTYVKGEKYYPIEFSLPNSLAIFDSRAFNIPKDEVANYFLARQKDAVKNSVAMLAQSLYSHKELHKKNGPEMQELCFQKGHNWNDLDFSKKRGSTIIKNKYINDKLVFPYTETDFCSDVNENVVLGDLWYQPTEQSTFYPDKRGRLLVWDMGSNDFIDWCDTEIKKIRNKWELSETPLHFNEEYFKYLV